MVETATLLPFASILFLVVVELSGRAAESDLETIARRKENSILGFVPDLGLLSIVHPINVFVLMAGYQIIAIEFISGDDLIITLLYLGMLIFLVILPYIEIDEYDLVQSNSSVSSSWNVHFLMSAIIMAEPYLYILLGVLPLGPLASPIGVAVFFGNYVFGTLIFLRRLRTQLDSADGAKEIIDDKIGENELEVENGN